jgi:DNA-binding transcriptional ArsR family regulator
MAIADKQARLLRCIEEPTRLRILTLLAEGEKYVGEIAAALGKEQSLVLYHLRALRKCNIVTVNPQSPEVYYKLSDARLAELVNISKVVLKDIFAVRPKENPNRKVDKLE